jgi:hypothetical protein
MSGVGRHLRTTISGDISRKEANDKVRDSREAPEDIQGRESSRTLRPVPKAPLVVIPGARILEAWAVAAGRAQQQAPSRLWLTVASLLILFRVISFLPGEVNGFAASHYLFSYAGGFHKRALPGALLGAFVKHLPGSAIYALSLGVLAAFTVALLVFMRKGLLASKEVLVLGLVLLGAPAVLPHFAYSIGYFDPVLVICALLTLAALDSTLADWLKLPLAIVPCAIGVLTHESYLFAAFPLVLASTLLRGKPVPASVWALTGLVGVMTLAVQFYGHPSIPLDQYVSQAASRTDLAPDPEAFRLLYFHLWDNYVYLALHYSSVLTDARLFAALIVPIPYFVMLHDLFGLATRATATSLTRLWMARILVLAPLILILVGFDALRWVSFACLNCSLLVFECTSAEGPEAREALTLYIHSPRFWILALLSFTLGPLHVVDGNGVATGIHSIAHGLGLVRW